jgi:hypothetical protein
MSTAATLKDDWIPRTTVDRHLERGCKAAINWWITKSNATLAASKRRQNFNAPSSYSPSWRAFKLLFFCIAWIPSTTGWEAQGRTSKESKRSLSPCTAASRELSQWACKRISADHWGDKEFF